MAASDAAVLPATDGAFLSPRDDGVRLYSDMALPASDGAFFTLRLGSENILHAIDGALDSPLTERAADERVSSEGALLPAVEGALRNGVISLTDSEVKDFATDGARVRLRGEDGYAVSSLGVLALVVRCINSNSCKFEQFQLRDLFFPAIELCGLL